MHKLILNLIVLLLLLQCYNAVAQTNLPPHTIVTVEHQKRLEAKLEKMLKLLEQNQAQINSLKDEVAELKIELFNEQIIHGVQDESEAVDLQTSTSLSKIRINTNQPQVESQAPFTERVLGIDIGKDERHHELALRPEIFIQTRYSTMPKENASIEDINSNFRLSRSEMRWSGQINDRFGLGIELQYHPAPDGAPEELLNDAFIEYYPINHVTMRMGQFIKPFGFDIQQSSSVRESPERAIFAGYFFPGQRDRGAIILGDLDFLNIPSLNNIQYFAGVFNGNRFFTDSNRQLNYNFRLRKYFESINLAIGTSAQLGTQLLPPGLRGNNNENIYGADLQYVLGRFGLRGEVVAGNMPSTELGIEPEFAPAFRPGRHSWGSALFATYQITEKDNIYVRYNHFNGDPITWQNVSAINFGYFRSFQNLGKLGESARIGFDFQIKDRLSFEDDAINTRLQITGMVKF